MRTQQGDGLHIFFVIFVVSLLTACNAHFVTPRVGANKQKLPSIRRSLVFNQELIICQLTRTGFCPSIVPREDAYEYLSGKPAVNVWDEGVPQGPSRGDLHNQVPGK